MKALVSSTFANQIEARVITELPRFRSPDISTACGNGNTRLNGESVGRSINQKPGWFLKMYKRHRQVGVNHALDGDPVGAAIRSYVAGHKEPLTGTVGAIGEKLRQHWQAMPGMKTKNSIWPESGKAIGNALHRLQPAMRLVGISIDFGPRKGDGYTCTIRKKAA